MAVRTRAELEALRDAFETGNPSNITAAKLRDFMSDVFDTLFTAGGAGIETDQIAALQAFVDSRVQTTSGEGSKVFLVTATYNATSGVLQFGAFRGGSPSAISVGDVVVFVSPSNIDDDQDITVDDGVNSSNRNLFDIDANVVQGRQLSPGRLYWAQRLFEGLFEAYHLALPLGVYQINPAQTANVAITNAQLKTLDTDPIEIIPAPGVGKVLEVLRWKWTFAGTDEPTATDTETNALTPDPKTIHDRGFAALCYVLTTENSPYYLSFIGGDPRITNEVYHFAGEGLRNIDTPRTLRTVVGNQALVENKSLQLAVTFSESRRPVPYYYSEAAWDTFFATANDNTMAIELEYYIHE